MVSKVDKAIQQLLEMNLDIKGSKAEIDLLWENASPTSAFANQTINLDLSAYNMVMVLGRSSSTSARMLPAAITKPVIGGIILGGNTGNGIAIRQFVTSQNYVKFDVTTSVTDNIPVFIYGIKI